jgi:hypothetical protein
MHTVKKGKKKDPTVVINHSQHTLPNTKDNAGLQKKLQMQRLKKEPI